MAHPSAATFLGSVAINPPLAWCPSSGMDMSLEGQRGDIKCGQSDPCSVQDLGLLFSVLAGPERIRRAPGPCSFRSHHRSMKLPGSGLARRSGLQVSSRMSAVLKRAMAAVVGPSVRVDHDARPAHRFNDVWEIGLPLVSAATSPEASPKQKFARLMDLASDATPDRAVMAMRARAPIGHRSCRSRTPRTQPGQLGAVL